MSFLKRLFLNFLASGLALYFTDYFLDVISIDYLNIQNYIKILAISVFALGVINTITKPLLTIISFPFLLLTLGLFSIIINAVIFFMLTIVVPEIRVLELWGYFVIPIILGIFNWVTHLFVPDKKK